MDQERDACSFYFWLTMTYDDENVPHIEGTNELCFSKEHCREFFEKLRKRYKCKGFTFKHFLVSEYGPNASHRPHYHCLLLVYSNDHTLAQLYTERKEMLEFINNKSWPYGFIKEKTFHGRVLSYLTKYCTKPELIGEQHTMKPFALISPGIGLSYLTQIPPEQIEQMKESLDFTVRYKDSKIMLPRYYVDRIVPHSLEDLRQALPKRRNGNWSRYMYLRALRERMNERNNGLVLQRVNGLVNKHSGDDFAISRELEQNRLAAYENFKSQLNNRKDL